jgi:hypothetical protein
VMLARDPAARPTALEVARQSSALGDELAEIYPDPRAESDELAKTRVMPALAAAIPSSRTAATRLMTGRTGSSRAEAKKPAIEGRRFPSRVTLIALTVVLLVLVVTISIALAVPQTTRAPLPSVASSTPSPTQLVPTVTPAPPPVKGKGPGKNH